MKCNFSKFVIVLITFAIGITITAIWNGSKTTSKEIQNQPLTIIINSANEANNENGEKVFTINYYVENNGIKTIKGYALGYNCNDGNYGWTIPNAKEQALKPGE